jgi:gliding motility-associated-like protein
MELLVNAEIRKQHITPVGPFCESDAALNLAAVDPGGTWSGTGITNTANGTFDPNTAGLGTHTITYGIAGQCGDTQTTTITILPDLDATITPVGPFCESDAALNLTAVDPGGTWSGTGITNAANGTFDPNTAGVGTHTITYGIASQCGDTQTVNITILPDADATITPAGPFCPLDPSVNLVGATAGGTWSGTGITNTTLGTFNPFTAGPGTHTITYGIAGQCGDTQTVNIVVSNSLDATINPVGPFCESDASLNLTAIDLGGTWSGTGITNSANGTFDPNTAGPGTHLITYGIPGGCGDTQTVNITILPDLDATITPVGPFCPLDPSVNLVGATAGGTWSGTGITNTTTGTFNPFTAGPGTHTITYGIAGQCGDTQTVNITVTNSLDATITPAGPFCESDASLNLTAVDPNGVWSGTGITNTTNGTFDPNTAGPGTHTITYGISGGCGDTQTVNITILPDLDATINMAGPFCLSDAPYNLSAVDPGGNWSGTGITNAANGTFDPNMAGVGTHTITYSIAGQCGDTQTVNITVNTIANAAINAAGPFCENDPVATLTSIEPGGSWSGPGITNAMNGSFDPSLAGAGTHTITYGIAGACGDTQTVNITVIPNADATITPVGTLCITDPAFQLVGVTPNGTWSGTGITNAGTGLFDPNVAGAGTHTITYTVAGACGDVKTTTITITPLDDPTITQVGPFCVSENPMVLTAATPGGTWSGAGITSPTVGSFDPNSAGPGTHTITYVTGGNCSDTDTMNIVVNGLPNVSFDADTLSVCLVPATPFEFTNTTDTTGGMVGTSLWNFGDGNTGSGTKVLHSYNSPGSYNVTLTVTSTAGAGSCTNSLTKNSYVNVYQNPTADFLTTPNPTTVFDPTINFIDQSYTNIVSWLWNFGGLGTSIIQHPTYTFPDDTGTYAVTLLVTDANGCQNSVTESAIVKGEHAIYIPNSFTPFSDDLNAIFIPQGFGISDAGFEFYIFDRWGENIFSSHSLVDGWDGTYKGKPVQNGTYVWRVIYYDLNGKVYKQTGHVNVLK